MELNATTLTSILSPQRGPVLTWFGQPPQSGGGDRERIELGGAVARRWVAKTDNFLAAEFPFGATTFTTFLPAHWRSPLWVITCWLRGLRLQPRTDGPFVDLVVASEMDYLLALQREGGPDMLIAQTTDSYAFSWPTDIPFGVTDGIADIMSYGDQVEMPHTASPDTLLISDDLEWLPPGLLEDEAKKHLRLADLLTHDYVGLGEDDTGAASESRPDNGFTHPRNTSPFMEDELPVAKNELSANVGGLTGQRILVTTSDSVLFAAQLIQLWLRGASVVWVPGGGEDLDHIATLENVTQRVPSHSPHA